MNQLSTVIIFAISVLSVLWSFEAQAQMEALEFSPQTETPISNSELIKLATNAPSPEGYSDDQEYLEAKRIWVDEHRNAYERIVQGVTPAASTQGGRQGTPPDDQ